MEPVREEGLLKTIRPPRLEDAGLEDCALPPEAIQEAFFKAANSIRSPAASILTAGEDEDDDDGCVEDPWPSKGNMSDILIGISPPADPPGPCGSEKGSGLPQVLGDEVVVTGVTEADRDSRVLGKKIPEVGFEGKKACVDGLQGLKIREDNKDKVLEGDEEEEADEWPILAETYV